MGFLSRLFHRRKGAARPSQGAAPSPSAPVSQPNENLTRLFAFQHDMEDLLGENRYIARSDYADRMQAFAENGKIFETLEKSGVLDVFCVKNGASENEVRATLAFCSQIDAEVERHNEAWVVKTMEEEKEYLDHILQEVDPAIVLDEDQRRVILTDEDYCLVIAGAGAGKTTTVAAKVKYLVERKGIDPSQILVVSFTNKAVRELRERIQGNLGIECPIATFHSTGNAILHKNAPEETRNIADHSRLYYVIRDYFRNSVMQNERMVDRLILFFGTYFDAPYEGDDLNAFFNHIARANYTTMRSDLEDFRREVVDARTRKRVTIQNEVLRSGQEVEIANFLYLNRIEYEYEPIYPYNLPGSRKPYTPDFVISQEGRIAYIEHFGISQDGENSRYTREELARYREAVNDKVRLHRQHGTALIYTFSSYRDGRTLQDHLQEELAAAGFVLKPRSNREVLEKLVTGEENRYIRKLVSLLCRFISNFKVNGYTAEDFARMERATENVRSKLFLEICEECYLEYARWLKEHHAVDFEDMINESARILREAKEAAQKPDFKYVIVDEYQDISRQRFDFTRALADATGAKIVAVGDDWQSIYAFSGSDITLFTKFEEKMGYAKMLKITRTYRNSQEVIDIAGNFIQKNDAQIRKRLISPRHIEDPVLIYTYDSTLKRPGGNWRSGENYAIAHAVEAVLRQLLVYKKREGREPGRILLLGRFGFDGDRLERSGLFEYIRQGNCLKSVRYPALDITFMTAHSSKGLGYDDVIVVNGKNDTYGFPSKIEDDPVLAFVIRGDHSMDYAEERRLFYVAMTRTKNRVFFIAPEQNPSEFLLELKRDYRNVRLEGEWNEEGTARIPRKTCPLCGYPMQLKYKRAYGLRLYLCTNEPELCGFMTNDIRAGKLSIQKCDCCQDGYLIAKSGRRNGYFLGCTNYKSNGTGCNRSIGKRSFYEQMGYAWEEEEGAAPTAQKMGGQRDDELKDISRSAADRSSTEKQRSPVPEEDFVEVQRADLRPVQYGNDDLNEVVFTVICALQNISRERYYGLSVLEEVLQGRETERILNHGLDMIPEFGALREWRSDSVCILLDWLLSKHLMLQTRERYPVLHSTWEGLHYAEAMTEAQLRGLRKKLPSKI